MNTVNKKSTKSILIILIAALVAIIAVGALLSLPTRDNGERDIAVTQTDVIKLYKETPYIMAETDAKAKAYAAELGIPENQYNYASTSAMNIENGVWKSMGATDVIGKYVHLLLPNSVTKIAKNTSSTTGIPSVHWLSIKADEGSGLTEIEAGTGTGASVRGAFGGQGWLERVDLTRATKFTSLSAYAFYACDRLYDIALPDSVTSIGAGAISGKTLLHVSLPSGLGASGSGLNSAAFTNCSKLVEIELPSNADSTFVSKVQGMTSVTNTYLNVYKKGSGRSWLVRTNDGFVFCKNISRTSTLASGTGITTVSYTTGKWYMVGYQGAESGGDTVNAGEDYMIRLPEQVDLATNGVNRAGQFDYLDCSGNEIQNDFSDIATDSALGNNVSGRTIAGGSYTYDIGRYAFYYQWVQHVTIPDNIINVIGDYAFQFAPMWTFNLGNVDTIGANALVFSTKPVGLTFYLPSNNPKCAQNALNYGTADKPGDMPRLLVYRNYANYSSRATYSSGIYYAAYSTLRAGGGKFFTYLIDVVPNVGEYDASVAENYRYTAIDSEKMQRLYTGGLQNYNSGEIYADPFSFVRNSSDVWVKSTQTFPALTEYTGYTETNWFTSASCTTRYTETSVGISADVASLRNPSTSNRDVINMYARKIVLSSDLVDKERVYTDNVVVANSEEITGIPTEILNNYDIQITSYVDSSGVQKTLSNKSIQDAGVYTIQIKPNAAYGQWDAENVPTMTVTVNKARIDLGDYKIFRLGVTSDNEGQIVTNLRPGKEVSGETSATLYKYGGSWFTDLQTTLGTTPDETRTGLWNSFVRAEGDDIKFRLALVTPIIKDAHRSGDVFTCAFSNDEYSQSGEYRDFVNVQLTEAAKNNYSLTVTSDRDRGFIGAADDDTFTSATIYKTWFIVKLNNWLTMQGREGDDAPSYHVPTRWEFGTDPSTLNVGSDSSNQIKFQAPTVALGSSYASIGFVLELTSKNVIGGNGTLTISTSSDGVSTIPISDYYKYVNSSMPAGEYRIIFSVTFSGGEGSVYEPFQQSFSFTVYDKAFSDDEANAISALNQKVFEYDKNEVPKAYSDNKALFDFDKLDDPSGRLKDMLGMNTNTWGSTPRVGEWANTGYNSLFDSNFAVTYNLNRMWNNTYVSLEELIKDANYPMDNVDVYTVYYQLTCKNRESLVDAANDTRRDYCFYVVVYKTLTAPTVDDITYDGLENFPTVRYENGALASERSYYSVTYPNGQDNVNVNKASAKKKAILTISVDSYEISGIGSYNLYRFADEGDTPNNRKFTQTLQKEYNIVPAQNSTTVALYMSGWLWNSVITEDNIIWETRFGNDRENFTFTLVSTFEDEDGNIVEISDVNKFGAAPAGIYTLYATCAEEKIYGNWSEYTASITVTVNQAVNTWVRTPSISTWTWNQYENFDWNAAGAVSPIEIHAIPTYYTSSTVAEAGSGRFDFRIYSIDENATGNDRYKMVYFDDEETEFHFQYAIDEHGEFIKDGSHFVLPLDVAKKLAALPAGQYYLVATVYSANNYTGLNNTEASFLEGAVPFTIGSANNVWADTITTSDWTYSEFELDRNIYTGMAKYETELTYAIYDRNKTSVISVLGKQLKDIIDFTDVALTKDGKEYTYAELINMLGVGTYTITVHGDEASKNERNGVNYLAINDERRVTVNKAYNTLNQTYVLNNFTIGGDVDMTRYTARFDSDKVGYRISKGGFYVDDNLGTVRVSENPITYESSLTYEQLVEKIKQLASNRSGSNDYTIWYVTTGGENYSAQSDSEIFTVFLGQNDWLDGITPTMNGWTYDKTAHTFDKSSINLIHEIDDSLIEITYHDVIINEESGMQEVGQRLSGCPINTGTYYVRITVPTDEYYNEISIDLPFQISKADNDFKTLPQIKNNGWVYSNLSIDDIITGAAMNEENGMQIQFVVTGDVSGDDETPSVDFRYATMNIMLGNNVDQGNNEILLSAFYSRLNSLNVGAYKMRITLTESTNYNAKELAAITLTVSKASNGWQDGKAPIINSSTKWEWNNYSDSVWKDVATKFGELTIQVNGEEVAYSAASRYLSTLEVGNHKIKFIVYETDNYNGFEDERSFSVIQNVNGWKDGEKDTTAYVDDWTWGEYNNGYVGSRHIWEQPAPKFGTSYAAVYKGKDGKGGALIAENIAYYSLDLIMNGLDAGSYYIIWTVAEDKNYKPLTREYINFEVKVNDNKWLSAPIMHENDKKASSGIDYGWSWGTYGEDEGAYFTVPKARYGIVEARIMKSRNPNTWSPELDVIIEGISSEVNIDNTLSRLDVGLYKIVWTAADPQNTGNYKVIETEAIEFIVNRGTNTWTDENPHIESWQWGAYSDELWQAPTLQSGYPNARVIKLNDDNTYGETVIPKSTPDLLGAQLAQLEVGRYRIIWTAEDDDNSEITGENPEELNFEVLVNKNSWVRKPEITANGKQWQWNTFTLEYWQRPIAQYYDATSDTPIAAAVYRLNDGCDFEYNLSGNCILDLNKCSLVEGITLATIDGINNLSVGKYLIKVSVSKDDVYGRYLGLETILPFTVVPNENRFTSDFCYVNDYDYSQFRGYWSAPTAEYGYISARVYKVVNGNRELIAECGTEELNDALKDLHTGTYALDWTIVAENDNYIGGQKITSYFEVEKADNNWTLRPTIKDWTWGSYDSSIVPMATPEFIGSEAVYFKIVDAFYGEIASFREYAARFNENANGYYNENGLVLTRDGYFTNIANVEEVIKNLKPGIYHLLAIYPEMEDYKRLDKNNDHIFDIYYAENKWVELPQIDNWFYGSPANLPTASSEYGTVNYTYYKAVYDQALGKYRIDGEAISTGENPPEKVGKYILVAQAEAVDGYGPLYAEVFFEIYDKYGITGVSGNLLVWINIALATIASITAAVIIYQLLKARRNNNDEIFNG
ncbi:MAG: leucine-rich repeat protein [Clostridiales bacterium]|nr:leucine-rich repeat protein [Clostridiales bacterium]